MIATLTCLRASADRGRVVLIDPGAELERAARAALEPWQVDIVVASVPSPGASAPDVHTLAREVARIQAANAVVWISEHNGGHALWVYDQTADHAVARPLSTPPPFDAPTAAAVALTLKTLLRHSASAPERERYGATESAKAPDLPARPLPGPEPLPTAQVGSLRHFAQFDLDAAAALRFNLVRAGPLDYRFGLIASYWPRARWGGLAVRIAAGPGLSLDNARFQGHLSSVTTGFTGRLRHDVWRWLRLSGGVGAGLDFTRLDGVALSRAKASARVDRIVTSLGLELGLDWLILPWLRIGLRGSAALFLRTQRYRVGGEIALELARVPFEGALVLGFGSPNEK